MVELGDISNIRKGKRFDESDDGNYFEIVGKSIDDQGNLIESKMKKVKIDENGINLINYEELHGLDE